MIPTLPSRWTASTAKQLAQLAAQQRRVTRTVALDALQIFERTAGAAEPWQRQLLTDDSQEILVTASRQVGKSTCCAAIGLATLLNTAASTVAIMATKEAQSAELLYRMRTAYHTLGQPLGRPLADGTTQLQLSNGSRAIALPASPTAARSYSINLLLLDESA